MVIYSQNSFHPFFTPQCSWLNGWIHLCPREESTFFTFKSTCYFCFIVTFRGVMLKDHFHLMVFLCFSPMFSHGFPTFPMFFLCFPMGFPSRTGLLSPRFPAAEAATEARDPSGFYHENTSKTIEIQTFLTIKPDITKNYVINIYIYVYIYH